MVINDILQTHTKNPIVYSQDDKLAIKQLADSIKGKKVYLAKNFTEKEKKALLHTKVSTLTLIKDRQLYDFNNIDEYVKEVHCLMESFKRRIQGKFVILHQIRFRWKNTA